MSTLATETSEPTGDYRHLSANELDDVNGGVAPLIAVAAFCGLGVGFGFGVLAANANQPLADVFNDFIRQYGP